MTTLKLIGTISWVLIGVWALLVLYYLLQPNGPTDAAGQGLESALKGFCVFLLFAVAGLNLLPYQWTKIVALLLTMLFLLVTIFIITG